jgi:hypothetical protein
LSSGLSPCLLLFTFQRLQKQQQQQQQQKPTYMHTVKVSASLLYFT